MAARAKQALYDVTVKQDTDGRWLWTITTRDFKRRPLYAEYGWKVDNLGGKARTAEKAIFSAAEVVAKHVAMDVRADLHRTFNDTSPVATATI